MSPDKLALAIHTEGKGYLLSDPDKETPGVYCPATQAPELAFSRQEGWVTYYEVLQLFYNDTIHYPGWEGLEPGLDHWTVHDHAHGNVDTCYMSPYAYQGHYWLSYDDPMSVDVKVRYANQYNLKGAFVYTVESDDFIGLFGNEKYGILTAINKALEGGDGLTDSEIKGAAIENTNCAPDYPTCRVRLRPSSASNSGVHLTIHAWADMVILICIYLHF